MTQLWSSHVSISIHFLAVERSVVTFNSISSRRYLSTREGRGSCHSSNIRTLHRRSGRSNHCLRHSLLHRRCTIFDKRNGLSHGAYEESVHSNHRQSHTAIADWILRIGCMCRRSSAATSYFSVYCRWLILGLSRGFRS